MDFAEGAGWWTAREDIKDMMVVYRSDQSKHGTPLECTVGL